MFFSMRIFMLIAALVLGGALPACADEAPASATPATSATQRPEQWAQPVPGIENLHRITPSLYRSEQFSKDDVAQLQELGIKKVISFRAFHSDKKMLAGSGIELQRIPINTWDIDDKDVIAALKALRNAERDGPVLIHCQHGADRTGLISAMYRIVYQGWSKEQALDELQNGDYGFHTIWRNITRYIKNVDVQKLREKLEE
ncbi:MAG: dual specificity protein phosphatase family protein [Methylobacillus sp.]|jgi:uncharacterized protein (TIGR01244 family)|nr:dual specificity protein phosphatase family protein [Methylobacillus sp.]